MSYDCHTSSAPRARKEHRCEECRGVIRVGEKHVVLSGICECEPYRVRMCSACEMEYDAANSLSWREGGEGLPFGTLHEDVFESHDAERMKSFIVRKLRRCAEVRAWMWQRWREHAFACKP